MSASRNKDRRATPPRFRTTLLHFAWRFLLVCAIGYGFLQSSYADGTLKSLRETTARVACATINALGTDAARDGDTIYVGEDKLFVINECTGVYGLILLVAFILAFPQGWGRRARAAGLALVLIVFLNQVRLTSFGLLVGKAPGLAEFAHDVLWQVLWATGISVFAFMVARGATATSKQVTP